MNCLLKTFSFTGTLRVIHYAPPSFLPRSLKGKLHIVFAHLRQLHLTWKLIKSMDQESASTAPGKDKSSEIDIFFVDQLSTCVPILRLLTKRRIVFYCHFPDKLIASGEFIDVKGSAAQGGGDNAPPESARNRKKMSLVKRLYRLPMDFLEEATTSAADLILVNSKFTARVFEAYFPSIILDEGGRRVNPNRRYSEEKERKNGGPRVVYPGINLTSYERNTDPQTLEEKLVYS
jgi:alpha-1,3/alpha-1,6-mannosyltransferase